MREEQTEYKIQYQFSDQKIKSSINSIDLEKVGKRFIVGCTDSGFYFLFDTFLYECKEIRKISNTTTISDISWQKVDNSVFASVANDKFLRLYNANSPRASFQKYELGNLGHSLSFHPSEPIIAVSLEKGSFRIFDLRESIQYQTYTTGFHERLIPIEWYTQNSTKTLLCGDDGGRIFAFDISGSSKKYIFSWYKDSVLEEDYSFAHDNPLISLQFSPNKHEFASLDSKGIIRIWDSDTGLSSLKGYHVDVPKENHFVKLKKMAYLENSLLVPETNGVVNVENDTKFLGHIDEVTAVLATDFGLITSAKDGFVNIWRKKEYISYAEDHSDWSD